MSRQLTRRIDGVVSDWSEWFAPPPARSPNFRRLLGTEAWKRLPVAVRQRFAHDQVAARVTTYRGRMQVQATLFGQCLAQLCRLIGTPVAPFVADEVPVTVRVFDKPGESGTVWERRYEFPDRAPVIVSSTKQVESDGTLVEALSFGLRMRLQVFEESGELHFLSTGYYFQIGRWRVELPQWLPPGATHVVHEDRGNGQFLFTMHTARHAMWPGKQALYWQSGVFE